MTAVKLLVQSKEKCPLKDFSVTPSFRKETLLSGYQDLNFSFSFTKENTFTWKGKGASGSALALR